VKIGARIEILSRFIPVLHHLGDSSPTPTDDPIIVLLQRGSNAGSNTAFTYKGKPFDSKQIDVSSSGDRRSISRKPSDFGG
jgi:hypothetical protein